METIQPDEGRPYKSHGTRIVELEARVAGLEAAGITLVAAYEAKTQADLAHVFNIPPGPDPTHAGDRLGAAVDAIAALLPR